MGLEGPENEGARRASFLVACLCDWSKLVVLQAN